MRTDLLARIFAVVALSVGTFLFPAHAWATPSITLSPSTATIEPNTEFTVNVLINVDDYNTAAADAIITFDPSRLEVRNVVTGGFYTDFSAPVEGILGRIEIHSGESVVYQGKTGSGTLAVITFRSKTAGGQSTVGFICGTTAGTQIYTIDFENILSCQSLNTLAVTVNAAAPTATGTITPSNTTKPSPTNTNAATPTKTGSPTSTPAPAANTEPTCTGLSVSPSQTVMVGERITLTCSGTDPNGNLTGAEFVFGDRNTRIVSDVKEQTASYATTYLYAKPGTYGASCRVKDNSGAWSGVPDACKKTVTVRSRPTGSPSATPKAASSATDTVPTPQYVELTDETTATPLPEPAETEAQSEDETNMYQPLVYGIIGVLVLIAFILIARRFADPDRGNPPVILPPTGAS